MNPIFTLQYPEFALAGQLQRFLPQSEGFSVFVPMSREEKGIDLIVAHKRSRGRSKIVTFQIKSSRTYTPRPRKNPRTEKLKYRTWFTTFDVQEVADYYLLFAVYFDQRSSESPGAMRELRDLTLLLNNREMTGIIDACLTKRGTRDKMFAFGFNDEKEIVQTRGNYVRPRKDFTKFLLANRINVLRTQFGF